LAESLDVVRFADELLDRLGLDADMSNRTYFVDLRGDEALGSTWSYLDITALGRQEEWEDSPEGYPQTPPYAWWNYHDAYGKTP
jgi:predicted dithiol-disulfide oxidoreductase (DUF899 family)